jgi:hypothetical protein
MLVLIQGAACFLEDESMLAGAGVVVESPKSLKDLPDLSN